MPKAPLVEIPDNTIPERLRPYLLNFDDDGEPTGLRGDRYEFWIYRQLRKRLAAGELYLDDSILHRRFSDELVAPGPARPMCSRVSISRGCASPSKPSSMFCAPTWISCGWIFDRELRQGKLKHLDYDAQRKTLTWRKPKVDTDEAAAGRLLCQLPARGIADIFRFVNERCRFLSALTPLQPRYAKRIADDDSLMAVIIAQAMGHGNLSMAETSDIPYHVLEATHQQHLRLSTLQSRQ